MSPQREIAVLSNFVDRIQALIVQLTQLELATDDDTDALHILWRRLDDRREALEAQVQGDPPVSTLTLTAGELEALVRRVCLRVYMEARGVDRQLAQTIRWQEPVADAVIATGRADGHRYQVPPQPTVNTPWRRRPHFNALGQQVDDPRGDL